MKKLLKNNRGFTLVEMMIVLLIISVLILISIPNVTKHSANIDEKSCQAFVKMLEGQVAAYKIEHKKIPSLAELEEGGYLPGIDTTCPNGDPVSIDASTGKVNSNNNKNGKK
ncbi:competence type IV pilus major pilin ComGC [Psychrobacillus psychrodurans]|jgi:competence protein ComGC|uniref:ComG operon protein 3 n=1 Tax=Psychrobacillus psychrodurans TaxID=126157 RepID=A0A9X3LDI0_9BACI|nr:competence type IV pilus major pilin ComGC [Psychrobacillus psychrodurans]MCZ8534816.1 prepilin-type N-terminal cleavage/methylation domain-containing protein [Psychrobacillus psychrodurans]